MVELYMAALARSEDDVKGELSAAVADDGVAMGEAEDAAIDGLFVSDAVLEPYSRKAFNVAGQLDMDVREGGRRLVQDSLARGSSIEQIMDELDAYFEQWVGPEELILPDDEGRGGSVPLRSSPRLENIARTEYMKGYNAGRQDLMLDPDVAEIMVGMQYSAVLDDRTTDYCRAWDGVVVGIEEREALAKHGPPAHYQCRSMWVPVTTFDDIPVTPRSAWPKEQPMVGFGGTA